LWGRSSVGRASRSQ